MKTGAFLFVFVFFSFTAAAELPISLRGYLKNTGFYHFSRKGLFENISQVRMNMDKNYQGRGALEASLVYLHASRPLNPFGTLKEKSLTGRIIDYGLDETIDLGENDVFDIDKVKEWLEDISYSSFYPKEKLILDRALVKIYFEKFDLFFGKQVISWGTGYGFNPTDIWNRKNPLDPNAEKNGTGSFRSEIPLGAVSGMSAVFKPGKDWRTSGFGVRLKSNVQRYDFSFSLIKDYTPDHRLLGLPEKWMAGADWSGEFSGIGFWGEGVWVNALTDKNKNVAELDSAYVQFVLGLDYTFRNGLHIMGEYYYNGLGRKKKEDYSLYELKSLVVGDMAGFGRDYFMLGGDREFFYHYACYQYVLVNLNDGSAVLSPELEYRFTDDLVLKLKGQIALGNKKESEMASYYSNLKIQITGYF